jgi:CRP-like cAMP-binding protein
MELIDILANYLKENTSFSNQEVETICSFFQPERLSKEEILFANGSRYSKIVFVAEGILRSFIYDDNGEEIIKTFMSENDFIAEINSFENGTPAAFNVAAITPCQLLTLSKTDSEKLIGHLPKWEMAAKEGMTKAMNLMIRKFILPEYVPGQAKIPQWYVIGKG